MIKFFLIKVALIFSSVMGFSNIKPILAATLETLNIGDNTLIELPNSEKDFAKVRIAIDLAPYESFLVQGQDLKKRMEYRVIRPIRHILRARIERTNHFHINDWHIETIPIRWEREARALELKLRFYKKYGATSELEEYIGQMTVFGELVGKDRLFVFHGRGEKKFKNKHGHPIIDIKIGPDLKGLGELATKASNQAPSKN